MAYYKVHIIYPNAEEEVIEEDFITLPKAIEYADHILGQVEYNAAYHRRSIDDQGDVVDVQPYCLINKIDNEGTVVVYDTRKN